MWRRRTLEVVARRWYSKRDGVGTLSKTKRDNRMRFFVMNGESERAIDMLKKTLEGSPVLGSSGEERFLRLPNPAVCNKVLHSAATKNPKILDDVRQLISELSSQSVRIYPRTLLALCEGYKQIGKADHARDVIIDTVSAASPDIAQDIFSALLEQQAVFKSRKGLVDAIKLMQDTSFSPTAHDCLHTILRMYIHGDELRYAQRFLSWMWFNYCIDESTGVWLQEKPSDALLGGQLLATQAKVLMDDVRSLDEIPSTVSATVIGLCAIDRNYDAAVECLSRIRDSGRDTHMILSLLQCYTRTQRRQELIQLVEDSLQKQIFSRKMLVQSIQLDADCHPDFCRGVIHDLIN